MNSHAIFIAIFKTAFQFSNKILLLFTLKKFHRDAKDKIVSPVIPQPGAWKRPPRLAATGARKPARRSTSISETEVLSPADEVVKALQAEGKQMSYNLVRKSD